LGLEVCDAAALEAEVGAGGLESFVKGAVVGGELPDPLFEDGVLGGDPLDGLLDPFGFQVADLAEEFSDAGALSADLGVGVLEGVLGDQRAFAPGRLAFVVLSTRIPARSPPASIIAAAMAARASGLS
jgi:hypothetical protein